MKILCTTSSFNAPIPPEHDVIKNPYGRRLTEEEVAQLLKEHQPQGLIAGVEPLTRKALASARELKVISRCGVGMDNVDLEAAEAFGITVRNTPEAPVTSVAELTLGLMLCLLRKITAADSAVRQGGWTRLKGNLLRGKRVGIIGCGRIGSAVAGLTAAFGCINTGYDPFIRNPGKIPLTTFEDLISTSDIISLHAPLSPQNRNIIDSKALRRMKDSAVLINTARGALIDEAALVKALKEDRIAGAALDVYAEEPYSGPLADMPEKTVLTCHIASSAVESRAVMEKEAVSNLLEEQF
ncbi:MAG: phosphoglycerate dehydrogenase [Spirochaetia bacterium]